MIRSVTFAGTTYAELPNRLEAGTPNIAGVIGLGAAIDYVRGLGFSWIEEREQRLLRAATEAVQAIDAVRVIGTAADKAPVLSFVVGDIHPHDLGTIADGEGVAIRTGHHCAQPVMQRFACPRRHAPRLRSTIRRRRSTRSRARSTAPWRCSRERQR